MPYSAPTTMRELAARLEGYGTVRTLASAFDVDTVDELRQLRDLLAPHEARGPARAALRAWLLAHADAR
ncbi:MAG: hypothetical protein ACXW61_13415 [Gemmatirosa sp.]